MLEIPDRRVESFNVLRPEMGMRTAHRRENMFLKRSLLLVRKPFCFLFDWCNGWVSDTRMGSEPYFGFCMYVSSQYVSGTIRVDFQHNCLEYLLCESL